MISRRLLLVLPAALPAAAESSDSFSQECWKAAEPVYRKTLAHPFLSGLRDGTLPEAKFQFYLVQDSLYLGAFGRALRQLAKNAPRAGWARQLRADSNEAVAVEKQMHREILASFGVPPATAAQTRMAPLNYAYTNHLLVHTAQSAFLEGLAAVLPCYWIYWEVGKELKQAGSPKPAYQRWIGQYAGEEYGATVRRVLRMADEAARSASKALRERALDLFLISARYEYLFWDMAWREEQWLSRKGDRLNRGVKSVCPHWDVPSGT